MDGGIQPKIKKRELKKSDVLKTKKNTLTRKWKNTSENLMRTNPLLRQGEDSFDFKGEKIKEAELLIDQLDLPCDILSEYDSFNSQDFSRDDVLFSPDNEDKLFEDFDPPFSELLVFKEVTQEKKLAVSFASWLFEDFDPPFSELLVFKEVTQEKKLAVSFASWLFEDFDPPFSELLVFKEVTQEKKLAVSFASWLFEDFDPPFSELLVF
nr:hypothetical protein [Tanacetum cinerariifolium]